MTDSSRIKCYVIKFKSSQTGNMTVRSVYTNPKSTDLSPIGHLWDVVELEIHIIDENRYRSNSVQFHFIYIPASYLKAGIWEGSLVAAALNRDLIHICIMHQGPQQSPEAYVGTLFTFVIFLRKQWKTSV